MTRLILLLSGIFFFMSSEGQAPNFQWAKSLGSNGTDVGFSTTTDASGNVYTTGCFIGTVDFDPGPSTYTLTSSGYLDIFILKLDAAGNFVWVQDIGGGGNACGNSICLDASGNICLTGYYGGYADFDPGPGSYLLYSQINSYDAFILKLDPSGNFIWVQGIGSGSPIYEYGTCVTADINKNVYATGMISNDIFVCKLDSSGNIIWNKSMGGVYQDQGTSLAVDNSGDVYISGYFQLYADFDPDAGTYTLTTKGGNDIFIEKLNPSGNFVWVKQIGGIGADVCNSIKLDPYGNIYSTGFFESTADFDPGAGIYNMTSAGNIDAYVSKCDSTGNFIWAKRFGGTFNDYSNSLALKGNDIFLAGIFWGTSDFDPGTATLNLTSNGSEDVFISRFDTSGNFIWAGSIGDADPDRAFCITVTISNDIYTTGYFQDSVDFDPNSGTYYLSSANEDIFIHKMFLSATGTKTNGQISEHVGLYPNPNNGSFILELDTSSRVIIFDILGQEIFHGSLTAGKNSVSLNDQDPGIYTIQIRSIHGELINQRIILAK